MNVNPEADDEFTLAEPLPLPEKTPYSMSLKKERRSDLPCKAIIRMCRKYYTERFRVMTEYVTTKRSHGRLYFSECLVKLLKNEGIVATRETMLMMGALLYPKDAKRLIDTLLPQDMLREDALSMITRLHSL